MQLSNFITRIIFTTAFISIIVAFIISIFFLYENFENDKLHIRKEFTEISKEQIKREIITVYNLIEQKEEETKNHIKEKLKERAEYAHNLAMIIYEQNKDKKTEAEIKLLITTTLNNLYYENDKTYFSMNTDKESKEGFTETNTEEPKISFIKPSLCFSSSKIQSFSTSPNHSTPESLYSVYFCILLFIITDI